MPILSFKAGRAFRREGTNFVDPSPTKGAIELQTGEDGLLHFMWRNRLTNEVEDDRILFPSDATFEKVPQSSWGRTYVLKFSSSDQCLFNGPAHRDAQFVRHINALLDDPETIPVWLPNELEEGAAASTSSAPAQASNPDLGRMQEVINSLQQGGSGSAHISGMAYIQMRSYGRTDRSTDVALSDVLTPANLNPLFTSHPELIAALFPHLPPDLPTPPSAEALQRIINSPQFRSAVRSFDQALRTGLLGNLVTQLGLPDEAGTGIEAFLKAVQEQADEDQMETD
ncbi:hypothetical protein HWV62_45611 [Athelia sp. TMB]|nr:hypothetical protein HWV62_45611 [Athelia sp. TMB]